jgi:ribonuclease HII
MIFPSKTLERKLFKSGYKYVCAVDEVGVGCLAGPVVVCAVLFDSEFINSKSKKFSEVRDSKSLSIIQREKLAKELISCNGLRNRHMIRYQVGYCYPKTIDRLNIYQATRLAIKRAVKKLTKMPFAKGIFVLVDGRNRIDGLDIEQRAIIKGDQKIFSIACASIIAKVYRDKMMVKYAKKYPNYGFDKHKGYGTKHHKAQLVSFGPCAIHRKSFNPVNKLV